MFKSQVFLIILILLIDLSFLIIFCEERCATNSIYQHATRNTIFSLQEFSFRNYLFFLIMLIKLIIEQRRNFVVDRRYKYVIFAIRSCRICVSFD